MNGKKIIDFKGKWIKWTLDFVQTDLNSVTKSKLRGLCLEMHYFASPRFGWELRFEEFLSSMPVDELPQIQITNFDEVMLSELRKQQTAEISRRQLEELEELISKMQVELPRIQESLSHFLEDTQNVLENFKKYLEEPSAFMPREGRKALATWIPLPKAENVLHIVRYTSRPHWDLNVAMNEFLDYPKWAILNFAKLMKEIPIHAITRCKGCARYFLNLSLREKIYCNSVCASRSIAEMKRNELKKHPRKYKAYLRKQRQYSKERYLRMRQARFGPNVKIGRKVGRKKLKRKED